MRRRSFLGLAVLAGLPLAVRGQQGERVRQIAMLSEFSEAQMQPLVAAFRDQLQRSGWKDGAFQIDLRFAITDAAQFKANAAALPDRDSSAARATIAFTVSNNPRREPKVAFTPEAS